LPTVALWVLHCILALVFVSLIIELDELDTPVTESAVLQVQVQFFLQPLIIRIAKRRAKAAVDIFMTSI
jgi:hypothetical protein